MIFCCWKSHRNRFGLATTSFSRAFSTEVLERHALYSRSGHSIWPTHNGMRFSSSLFEETVHFTEFADGICESRRHFGDLSPLSASSSTSSSTSGSCLSSTFSTSLSAAFDVGSQSCCLGTNECPSSSVFWEQFHSRLSSRLHSPKSARLEFAEPSVRSTINLYRSWTRRIRYINSGNQVTR